MLAEHPEILEVLEKSPKSVAEFLERTGLAEKVESARVAGMQAAKDREIAELKAAALAEKNDLQGKIDSLTGGLDAAKAETSALSKQVEDTQKALAEAQGELASVRDRLSAAETAHRKLTGGTLHVGETVPQVKSMSEFVKDHGGSFSRAVKEDPETYRAICAKLGCAPVALQ